MASRSWIRFALAAAAATASFAAARPAAAQECLIGEVRMFAGNFAPQDWLFADGSLLSIAQNSALFSVLGTTYGGNGTTNFALPDLRGRVPTHPGTGPGLSPKQLGEQGGTESHTLLTSQLPPHAHPLVATDAPAESLAPDGQVLAAKARTRLYAPESALATSAVQLSPQSVGATGGGQPVAHLPPWLGLNYIVCVQGIYPSRP